MPRFFCAGAGNPCPGLCGWFVGHVSESDESGGRVMGADAAFIVTKDHIHDPVQAVSDRPMAADDCRLAFGWQGQGCDVEAGLGFGFVADFASAFEHDDGIESWPVITPWKPMSSRALAMLLVASLAKPSMSSLAGRVTFRVGIAATSFALPLASLDRDFRRRLSTANGLWARAIGRMFPETSLVWEIFGSRRDGRAGVGEEAGLRRAPAESFKIRGLPFATPVAITAPPPSAPRSRSKLAGR